MGRPSGFVEQFGKAVDVVIDKRNIKALALLLQDGDIFCRPAENPIRVSKKFNMRLL